MSGFQIRNILAKLNPRSRIKRAIWRMTLRRINRPAPAVSVGLEPPRMVERGIKYPLFREHIKLPDGMDVVEIGLIFQHNGSLCVEGLYVGPKAKAFWGDIDHEFWMTIPASHTQQFFVLIAQDAFCRDGCLTYAKLCDLCTRAAIPIETTCYT